MIEWFKPAMTGDEAEAIEVVLQSGYLNDGPVTIRFENEIAALCGRKFAVACCNGTSAITLALMACSISGDVIVPAFTFIATANAARLAGCNVVLADIEPDTFCLSAKTVDAVRTAKSRAVVAVEVNGRYPEWAELNAYCKDTGLTLITDSCEALGTGGKVGAASAFSFSPQKLITTGQGGMVVTDDGKICKRLQELKRQGMAHGGTGGADRHLTLGYNFKFTDIQAAIGIEQLKALPERLVQCRQRDRLYYEALAGIDGIELPQDGPLLWTDILADHQFAIHTALERAKIGSRCFWYPLNTQPPYLFDKKFPVAQEISSRGIWLPSACNITPDEIGQVADCIKRCLNGRNSRAA